MKFNDESMRKRGWSEEEIENTKQIINKASNKPHKSHKHFKRTTYWLLFLGIVITGVGGLLMASPLLLFLRPTQGYVLVAFIGLIFGFFAGKIIKNIEHLEKQHHLIISIVIPIIAIISSLIIAKQLIITAKLLERSIEIHPLIIGVIFSICLLTPYNIFIYLNKSEKK